MPSVANGCQSLSTIYATGGKVSEKKTGPAKGSVLFRCYEIPQYDLGEAISINTNSQRAVKPRDLRSNDKYMRSIKTRYESQVPGAYLLTKRGEERPAHKESAKCVDSPDYAEVVVSWMCQRPNLATNDKRLFGELYKTVFHPERDALSLLALKLWTNEIDKYWPRLDINEAVKAVKGAARFHMLFIVSPLLGYASNQSDKVPLPSATMDALKVAGMVLGQAKQCWPGSRGRGRRSPGARGRRRGCRPWPCRRGASGRRARPSGGRRTAGRRASPASGGGPRTCPAAARRTPTRASPRAGTCRASAR